MTGPTNEEPSGGSMGARKPAQKKSVGKVTDGNLRGTAPKLARDESGEHQTAAWGLLVYLAGDTENGHEAIREDLVEILTVGGSGDLRILVQHDSPHGAARYVVQSDSSPDQLPVQRFSRIDSGSTAAFLDFLRWGLSVCRAERLALIIGSPLSMSPAESELDPDRGTLFSIAYDAGSGRSLDICDMAGVLREALRDAGRDELDVLAIDTCGVQFIELAYELEDIVRVVIAPQTGIPIGGWDYRKVLAEWIKLAAQRPQQSTPHVVEALLEPISASYADGPSS